MIFFRPDYREALTGAELEAAVDSYNVSIRDPANKFASVIISFASKYFLHDARLVETRFDKRKKKLSLTFLLAPDKPQAVIAYYTGAILSELAILTLTRLGTDVRYFVDLAEFGFDGQDWTHSLHMGCGAGNDGIVKIIFKEFTFRLRDVDMQLIAVRPFVIQ